MKQDEWRGKKFILSVEQKQKELTLKVGAYLPWPHFVTWTEQLELK